MNKKNIFIVIPGLNVGGVDKSLLSFCDRYSDEFDISLLIFGASKTLVDSLPKNIKLLESTKRLHILTTNRKGVIRNYGLLWYLIKAFFYFFSKLFSNKLAQKFFTSTYKSPSEIFDYAIAWSNDGNEKSLCFGSEYIVLNKIYAKKRILYMHNDYFKNHIYGRLNNNLLNRFDYIWCISENVRTSLFSVVINKEKLKLCHCFVNVKEIENKSKEKIFFDKKEDEIVFVSSCRLSDEKGIDRGIKVFSEISKETNIKFRWVIVGGGDSKYEKLSKKLSCGTFIEFIGQKENPYPYIKMSDVYLSLSRYEGAPISFLEAKALNKKIITTNYISANEQLSALDMIIPNNDLDIKKELIAFLKCPVLNNTGKDDVDAWNKKAEYEIRKNLE